MLITVKHKEDGLAVYTGNNLTFDYTISFYLNIIRLLYFQPII